jgi:hypothetical protein
LNAKTTTTISRPFPIFSNIPHTKYTVMFPLLVLVLVLVLVNITLGLGCNF